VTATGPDSLRLELLVPERVRTGERVVIRLGLQNVGPRSVDLYLRGRTPTFDVVVARTTGDVIWRRLEGEIILAIVHLRPLAPGERLEAEVVWDQRSNAGEPVGAGRYRVQGLLLVEGEPRRTPSTSLRIAGADE